MPVPIWAARYIGLPFEERGRDRAGLDCWGLVRLVMAEQFGRSVPSFSDSYTGVLAREEIAGIFARALPLWTPVPGGQERQGDVIVLRLRGQPMHVGLVLGDRQMLHVERGIDSAIETYTGPRWADRIHGFYRYRSYDGSS